MTANIEAIPSVIGQLVQQLQVDVDSNVLSNLADTPNSYYDNWTVTYVAPELRYIKDRTDGQENICRMFTEAKKVYGYDFIVNEVADKFEAIFDFDILNHAIKVKLAKEITSPTNIYLSYDNVVNELQTTEKSGDITTVLNCEGNNLNIQAVNPTGTNYIADFSYYMYDEEKASQGEIGWMSKSLSQKIATWKIDVENARPEWINNVRILRDLYKIDTDLKAEKQFVDLKIKTMEDARDAHYKGEIDKALKGTELELVEEVLNSENSLDEASAF